MTDTDVRELGFPGFGRLSISQIERLHQASLEVLERTGARFYDQEALSLFKKGGSSVSDGNLVRIPPYLVEWALRTAPKNITIYNRDGQRAMELGGYRCYCGVGSDCMYIYDLDTGQRRLAVLEDVVKGVRLVNALPNIDFVMSMFMPSDVPAATHERHQMAVMLKETKKPIVFVGEEAASTVYAIRMAAAVAGGLEQLQRYPFVINYVNARSSLQHNQESVQRLLYAAELNIPSIYSPGNHRGTTAPITAAGAVVLGAAGQLAGLVLTQLKREGAPFIRNYFTGSMDLRTMVNIYNTPDTGPLGLDLAHYHRLPIFGFGGCSDAKIFDAQAAADAVLTLMTNMLAGANLIHDIGYLDCAMSGSLELVAYCDEVIGWLKRYLRRPEISEETIARDVIDQVGADGTFLETEHTLRHMREDWSPTLFDRFDYPRWADRGATTLQERANRKVKAILEKHQANNLSHEMIRAINIILDSQE